MQTLERAAICHAALSQYGACIITRDLAEAVEIANHFAPEHLELATANAEALLPQIRNAGAIFLGSYTPADDGRLSRRFQPHPPHRGNSPILIGLGCL